MPINTAKKKGVLEKSIDLLPDPNAPPNAKDGKDAKDGQDKKAKKPGK